MSDRTPDYSGMTLNERLFAAGKLEEFEEAIRLGERSRAIAILQSVDVDVPERTVDAVLADPTRYGPLP